jgi:hypothetical protein
VHFVRSSRSGPKRALRRLVVLGFANVARDQHQKEGSAGCFGLHVQFA